MGKKTKVAVHQTLIHIRNISMNPAELNENQRHEDPLVNVYITMERSTIFRLGKFTISVAVFNSELFVIIRGYQLQDLRSVPAS